MRYEQHCHGEHDGDGNNDEHDLTHLDFALVGATFLPLSFNTYTHAHTYEP